MGALAAVLCLAGGCDSKQAAGSKANAAEATKAASSTGGAKAGGAAGANVAVAPDVASPGSGGSAAKVVAPIPAGRRVQLGLAAGLQGEASREPWLADGASLEVLGGRLLAKRGAKAVAGFLKSCPVDTVDFERRLESGDGTLVVLESNVTFEKPFERARALWWVEVQGKGGSARVVTVRVYGDGTFSARCANGCEGAKGAKGACPSPRLRPVPEPSAETEEIAASPSKSSHQAGKPGKGGRPDLARVYERILGAQSTQGGFELYIAGDATLEDVGTGRVRRGVDGFVEALRSVERRFPAKRRVSGVTAVTVGDWVVARFVFEGTAVSDGPTVVIHAAEVARFDELGKLQWSRGYARPAAPR